MFKDAKRFVTRTLKKPNYEHTHLPEGYEKISQEYRSARKLLNQLSSAVKDLRNYEHGGKLLKNVTKLTNTLSSSTKIKALHRDDIFTNAAVVASQIVEEGDSNSELGTAANWFSRIFFEISEAKVRMNEAMEGILISIEALHRESKRIDEKRKHVEDLRMRLEEMIVEGNITGEKKKKQEAEFNFEAGEAFQKMSEFNGVEGVAGILKRVIAGYSEFVKAETKILNSDK